MPTATYTRFRHRLRELFSVVRRELFSVDKSINAV